MSQPLPDLIAVALKNAQLVVERDIAPHPDPMARLGEIIRGLSEAVKVLYEPSGLDEFHPDTTHNPESSTALAS